ncbi:PhlD [Streptomyces sp. BPTC-684]|uniref:PhlD n=1 Tax=Streptomyces sp. BPTC-684 TaxID=3043734 RepID=UPI0024B077E1|nr:PhlD [Streptomyces sp. BPTC-684]WHM37538.1 PhlD [Streptomyces sp. BPTC-684]
MPAHIALPAIVLPDHLIATDEICADIRRANPDRPRLEAHLRIARATTVRTRRFTRPLDAPTVAGNATVEERNRAAYEDALRLAVRSGRRALAHAGLAPDDIDCVITSHTTSWTVPSLDVALVRELGLRPDVRRVHLSTVGCAGGAHSLVRAHEDIAAHPGSHVLVVVSECLSTATYNHTDTSRESMIYKVLFGDGSGAVVVSDTPAWSGPSFVIEDTFEYVLPDSIDRYRGRLTAAGLHFDSTAAATTALSDSLPAVRKWLGGSGRALEFAVVHPGGPRILEDAAAGFGLDGDRDHGDLRHAWASLAANGNLGGSAVLDVLARTFAQAPGDRQSGLIIGFGPGFVLAASRGHWSAGAEAPRTGSS